MQIPQHKERTDEQSARWTSDRLLRDHLPLSHLPLPYHNFLRASGRKRRITDHGNI